MSKYGQEMLKIQGINSFYIPHGIEDVFEPTETLTIQNEKVTGRKFLGLDEDAFVVGMNAANKGVYPNRKAFGENFLAFSQFAKDKPNAFLYVHTDPAPTMGGIDLTHLAQAVGLKEEQVIFADRYSLRSGFSHKMLAALYSSFDVLLATSMGEGFGIPTVEAQACGTRVIVSDFAASSELVGDGWKIKGQPVWDAPQLAWFHVPYVDQIINALEESYNADRAPSIKAMEHAEQYKADNVFQKHWKPALKAIWSGDTPDPVQFGTN
jgi:glycosyltransferase involved in cell wall biosynthesis